MLHLSKVAVGCDSPEQLVEWLARHADAARLNTKSRPRRDAECVGGSLYWIHKHRFIGRSEITAFEEAEGGRTNIVLRPRFVPVVTRVKRAHQGWRYLEPGDAPKDLAEGQGADELPPGLVGELAALGLL